MRPGLHRPTLAALFALSTLASLLAPAHARAEAYWIDGCEVEVTLRPLHDSFSQGEPVDLVLVFESRSGGNTELLLSGSDGRDWPDDFEVRVTSPEGKPVPRPERGGDDFFSHVFLPAWPGGPEAPLPVHLTVPLKNWANAERPGVYRVSLRRGVAAGPYKGNYRLWPWTRKQRSELLLETEFRVVGVGELIEGLAASALACNQPDSAAAAARLVTLADERTIGPLAEALGRCGDSFVRYHALQGLSKFSTDAAFEAMRAAASDPDEDLRSMTVYALAGGARPEAYGLLVSMRQDSNYGVRLAVLGALEGKNTEAARRLIRKMTLDEHPWVRAEALRFLQQPHAPTRQ